MSLGKIPNNKHFGINAVTGNWKIGLGTNEKGGFGAGASFSSGGVSIGVGRSDDMDFKAKVNMTFGGHKKEREPLF